MSDSLYPSLLIPFLSSTLPEFASLSEKQQTAAARSLFDALISRQPHKSGVPGIFCIFWEDKQRRYGTAAAFDQTNEHLNWFKKIISAKVGRHATGFVLTGEAEKIGTAFFEHSIDDATTMGHLVTSDGAHYRKAPHAVRSKTRSKVRSSRKIITGKGQARSGGKTSTTGNSIRFKRVHLKPEIRIDTEALRTFYVATQAWLQKRACPKGSESLWQEWKRINNNKWDVIDSELVDQRVRRASFQSLGVLDIAKQYGPSADLLPCTYIEAPSGRLNAEGALNLQRCVRELRKAALKGCYDVDVDNCHFVLFSQLAQRHGHSTPEIGRYLHDKDAFRRKIATDLEVSPADAKFILLALVYGARLALSDNDSRLPAIQKRIGDTAARAAVEHELLRPLSDEINLIRNKVVEAERKKPKKAGWVINDAGRQIGSKSEPTKVLAHLLQGAESEILRVCLEALPGVVLAQHDGITSRDKVDTKALAIIVKEQTGYAVTFSSERL